MEDMYAKSISRVAAEAMPARVWWAGAVASGGYEELLRLQAEALEQQAAWCRRRSPPVFAVFKPTIATFAQSAVHW